MTVFRAGSRDLRDGSGFGVAVLQPTTLGFTPHIQALAILRRELARGRRLVRARRCERTACICALRTTDSAARHAFGWARARTAGRCRAVAKQDRAKHLPKIWAGTPTESLVGAVRRPWLHTPAGSSLGHVPGYELPCCPPARRELHRPSNGHLTRAPGRHRFSWFEALGRGGWHRFSWSEPLGRPGWHRFSWFDCLVVVVPPPAVVA